MSSYVHVDNRKKDILILGEGPEEGLTDTALTAEKGYSFRNCTEQRKKVCIIMGWIVIYLLTVLKYINLKQEILK